MSAWVLAHRGFEPASEGLREALCTLGNGYVATRGAAPEARADGVHYPATYAAGVFNRLSSTVAGRTLEDESIVNLPNWLPLTFRAEGGCWLDDAELLEQRLELDMRRGVLTRFARVRDGAGRATTVTQRRIVSMDDPHLVALETTLVPENWSGLLQVRSSLDGTVRNAGVARYRALAGEHLTAIEAGEADGETVVLRAQTTSSRILVAEAARTRVTRDGAALAVERTLRPGAPRGRARALRRGSYGGAGDDREGRRPDHVARPSPVRASPRGLPHGRQGARLRRTPGEARGRLARPLASVRDLSRGRRGANRPHRQPPPVPSPADPLSSHGRARRGRAGPRPPRRGIPRPCLLGRALRDPVHHAPAAAASPRIASLPVPAAARSALGGAGGGLLGRDVPVAEWQRRARGDSALPPEPALRSLEPRQLLASAARQRRDRLQRLALLPGHRRCRLPRQDSVRS